MASARCQVVMLGQQPVGPRPLARPASTPRRQCRVRAGSESLVELAKKLTAEAAAAPGENGCKCGGKSKPGAAEQEHSHSHKPPTPPAAAKKSCSSSTSGGASSAAMEQLETRYLGGTSGVKRGDLEFVHALGLERQALKNEAFLDVDALLRDAHADGGDGLVFSEEELL